MLRLQLRLVQLGKLGQCSVGNSMGNFGTLYEILRTDWREGLTPKAALIDFIFIEVKCLGQLFLGNLLRCLSTI